MFKINNIYVKVGGNGTVAANNHNPIFVLAMRLQYYCIVQTVSRIGASWYQFTYGFDYDPSTASTLQSIAFITQSALTPSAGFGYLIVFLLIQPQAWVTLKDMLPCKGCCRLFTLTSFSPTKGVVTSLTTSGQPLVENYFKSDSEVLTSPSFEVDSASVWRESEFPLLEMDEDEIASQIDRFNTENRFFSKD